MNSTSVANQNRNTSVDTFRLLAALCVIILHLEYPALPGDFAILLRLLSRWAIPFFFIISGYYFAIQNTDNRQLQTQKTVGRLIWIFLLWSIIYIPVIADQHDFNTVLQRVFSPNFIFFGSFLHLWFISSLIFGYLFIAFCDQFNLKYILILSSVAFVVIALINGPYPIFNTLYPLGFGFSNHWLSIPFLTVGYYFHKKGYPSWWLSLILIVIGAAAQVWEVRFIYHQYRLSAYQHEFLIGTIPFALGMTGLALNNLRWLRWTVPGNWGREYSLGIYLIHPLVIYIVSKWVYSFVPKISETALWQALFPVIMLGLCILLLSMIQRWLPRLFNFLFGKHVPAA